MIKLKTTKLALGKETVRVLAGDGLAIVRGGGRRPIPGEPSDVPYDCITHGTGGTCETLDFCGGSFHDGTSCLCLPP